VSNVKDTFKVDIFIILSTNLPNKSLPMDCYLDVVGGLEPLRCEEGRPKAVRDKVAGKGQQHNY
jgi:hypothetical protein